MAAVKKCTEIGCAEIEVSTEKNNSNALEFYRKCGFKKSAILLEMHIQKLIKGE